MKDIKKIWTKIEAFSVIVLAWLLALALLYMAIVKIRVFLHR